MNDGWEEGPLALPIPALQSVFSKHRNWCDPCLIVDKPLKHNPDSRLTAIRLADDGQSFPRDLLLSFCHFLLFPFLLTNLILFVRHDN